MAKYDVNQEIMRNYEQFILGFSPFCEYLFLLGQLQKYSVYHYSVLRYSIIGNCDIDFYNFRHRKVRNFENSNLLERH